MKTTIGGDRLGSGNKQNVSMKNYKRSSHDMSYLWRSSMASGTLVPFMSEVGLPGDNFDINLDCSVLTLPTVGPLFGSYKVQLDVFSIPMRLYNGKLHMNKLGIGMDMSKIMIPQLDLTAYTDGDVPQLDNSQINSSCLLSYLNIRGLGVTDIGQTIKRQFNAIPYLSYWDIYKNYYANKQEEEGVAIHVQEAPATPYDIVSATAINPAIGNMYDNYVYMTMSNTTKIEVTLGNGNGTPKWDEVGITKYTSPSQFEIMMDVFAQITWPTPNTMVCENYIGDWNEDEYQWSVNPQSIESSDVPTQDTKPNLNRFPLSNIDDMRENILKAVSNETAFIIDENSAYPYSYPMIKGISNVAMQYGQEALAIKTYQSDLFNNWISTEWIDGTNGVNEVTAVDTSSGNFTIDSLNLANKVYNMLNRIAISGGSYDDWLDAVYTHERSKSVESPVYEGSLIKELSFEEVVSTADTSGANEQPLGTLAGRGKLGSKHKGGKIKVRIDEPSYIMGIVSITPKVDYSQGNKWDGNLKTFNDFHKPALDEIGYQDLITDGMAWFDTNMSGGTPIFKSAGKQPAWINYMTNVNQVRGNFAELDNSMFMVLNRRYESNGLEGITDLTTYIDPSKFNHIFADTRLDAQNFWVQISNNITARRKMSAKVIPNL